MVSDAAAKYEFYNKVVCNIAGWLHQGAAIRTIDILEFQEEKGIAGSLLEIGVFSGRYFSILLRSASRTDARIVGVDLFRDPPVGKVRELVTTLLGGSQAIAILLSTYSIELDAMALLVQL